MLRAGEVRGLSCLQGRARCPGMDDSLNGLHGPLQAPACTCCSCLELLQALGLRAAHLPGSCWLVLTSLGHEQSRAPCHRPQKKPYLHWAHLPSIPWIKTSPHRRTVRIRARNCSGGGCRLRRPLTTQAALCQFPPAPPTPFSKEKEVLTVCIC